MISHASGEDDDVQGVDPRARSFTTTATVRRTFRAAGDRVNCAVRFCYLQSWDQENGLVRGPRLTFA